MGSCKVSKRLAAVHNCGRRGCETVKMPRYLLASITARDRESSHWERREGEKKNSDMLDHKKGTRVTHGKDRQHCWRLEV